jgi:hypothetical protein
MNITPNEERLIRAIIGEAATTGRLSAQAVNQARWLNTMLVEDRPLDPQYAYERFLAAVAEANAHPRLVRT